MIRSSLSFGSQTLRGNDLYCNNYSVDTNFLIGMATLGIPMERFAFFFPKNYLFFWYLLLHSTGLLACSWSLWEKDQLGHLCLFFSDKSFSAFLSLNKFIVNVADLKFIFPDKCRLTFPRKFYDSDFIVFYFWNGWCCPLVCVCIW